MCLIQQSFTVVDTKCIVDFSIKRVMLPDQDYVNGLGFDLTVCVSCGVTAGMLVKLKCLKVRKLEFYLP